MLVKRNGIFYYRKAIPKSVRAILGRRELLISLKTRHTSLALQKAHTVDITVRRIIHEAILGDGVLEFDLDALKAKLTRFETEESVEEMPDGSKRTTTSKRIDPAVIEAMKDAGVSPERIAQTVSGFMEIDSLIPEALQQPVFSRHKAVSVMPLHEYVKKYIKDWEHTKGREMDPHNKTQLRRLCEIFDTEKTIGSFTELDAATVRNALSELPSAPKKYAGLTVNEAVKAAYENDPEYDKVTITTLERHFETYQALFKKAASQNYHNGENPFQDKSLLFTDRLAVHQEKFRRNNAKKEAYSQGDLEKMFTTGLHMNYGSDETHENVKFWLPLIGLFTGSRMSQLASLYTDDIKYKGDIPVISFNFKTKDKLAKTGNSYRDVPIHPLLLKLGIFEFAEKVASYGIPSDFGGGPRLFPELRNFARGSYARRMDDWFNRSHLTDIGVRVVSDNKSGHAFRATLQGLLKRAGHDELTRNCIIGWASNEEKANLVVREHYESVTFAELQEAVSSIQLPDRFYEIPPFPVEREMNFERKYRNQWRKNGKVN